MIEKIKQNKIAQIIIVKIVVILAIGANLYFS
jgi:hypothetical protein